MNRYEDERSSPAAYFDTLQRLRSPRGSVICRGEEIATFWEMGANLDDLVRLFAYEDSQGNEKFFAQAVTYFLRDGKYSTRDLLTVAELVDHEGNPIMESSNDFWDFMAVQGKIEDAQALATIRDSENFTVYRNDRAASAGGEDFDGFMAMVGIIKVGVEAGQVQELVDIRNDQDISVFRSPRDIKRFLENGGDPDFVLGLLDLRDDEKKQIFNEFYIALFKQYKGSVEYAKALVDLKDTEGQTVFSDGKDVVNFFYKTYGSKGYVYRPINLAKKIIGLLDNQGRSVFRDGKDIVNALRETKDSIDPIYPYLQITDAEGNTSFNGEEIATFLEYKIPVDYVEKLAKQGLNGTTIMYYFQLGLKEDQINFENSGQPKALVVYPIDDPEVMIGQAFRDEYTFDLLKRIATSYDFKLRAISSTEELFRELGDALDTYLLIMAGHGSGKDITFGKSNSKYASYQEGNPKLTLEHGQLREHLVRMTSLQHILLDSCLAGVGGDQEENMVNFIAKCAPGVLVTGPMSVTNARLTKVEQMYPPDFHLLETYTNIDCTYSRKVNLL